MASRRQRWWQPFLHVFAAPNSGSGEAIRNDDLTRRDLAATLSNRGIILSANGKYREALKDHNRAIELAPSLAPCHAMCLTTTSRWRW
ncbi:MAG: tetratricopeptide repeat protein [Gammaproteobacteria bacterium]|nr:tetratricopeptide repeat protein [Gammaproteobacteria bacterium]